MKATHSSNIYWVQLSTRKWLELNQQPDRWRKESLRRLAMNFPSGQYETWAACQVLLPHCRVVLSYLSNDKDKDEVLNRVEIANNMTLYLYLRGEYAAAEKVGRVAVEGRVKVLGQENPNTLSSTNILGVFLDCLGKFKEAGAIQQRCLEEIEKIKGPEHPNTLGLIHNLGTYLELQG